MHHERLTPEEFWQEVADLKRLMYGALTQSWASREEAWAANEAGETEFQIVMERVKQKLGPIGERYFIDIYCPQILQKILAQGDESQE